MPAALPRASNGKGSPMLRFHGRQPNPRHATRTLGSAFACLALAFPMAAGVAAAQKPDSLPSAPQPQLQPARPPALKDPSPSLLDPKLDGVGRKSGDTSPAGREPQDAPIVSMAPHHGNDRYWLSGHANIIIQGDLPLHSPYQGTNSFISRGEYKTSLLGTLDRKSTRLNSSHLGI